jgi:hypothetical protein
MTEGARGFTRRSMSKQTVKRQKTMAAKRARKASIMKRNQTRCLGLRGSRAQAVEEELDMSTPFKETKHARLAAQALAKELKTAENSDDDTEIRGNLMVALVRCQRIYEYIQGRLNG